MCARGDFEAAREYYSPEFIDHVNEMEYRGQEGIRQSVGLYHLVFTDLLLQPLGDGAVRRRAAVPVQLIQVSGQARRSVGFRS